MNNRRSESGLSIAEIMVASGILAVVLVTVMTLFGQLIRNTEKNSLLSAGAFFADSVLEKQIIQAEQLMNANLGSAAPSAFPASVEGEGKLSMADDQAQTKYLYRVDAERMPGVSADPGQMWFLNVEVRWWTEDMSNPDAMRGGYGNMSVKRGRLVYIRDQRP